MHPRFRLSRLQRRRRRPQGVRRGPAACRGGRAQMAEPPFRECGRVGRAAIRRPLQPGRRIPVLLRRDDRLPDRPARRDPEAAGNRPPGHPYPDRDRVLAAAGLACSHRHPRQRPAAAIDGAGLFLGQLAAFCRPDPETAGPRHPPEFSQYRGDVLFRAMIDAMDRWATDGIAPPDSRIPQRADGTVVQFEEWRRQFPAIPGVALPHEPNSLRLLDFGPEAEHGILKEPPDVVPGEGYTVLVPG